ncbi:hypothetical protein [Burkholderia vietnamiensis]|uniref:hypothetical protein n=1 Tax=Burkholderia vietnamiensis TaxID=60552 RepID=UPI0012D9F1BB|nr:hypothetical protein [Burkholderia vietnamiensis]MDN7926677.1 hypothetical protein [Burkholderia vietnamiensis]HDR9250554.1 hypothetical protein [Burkholderia vietnamiensis]
MVEQKAAVVALRNASIAVTAATPINAHRCPHRRVPHGEHLFPPAILLLMLLQPGRQNGSRFEVTNPASVKPQRIA